MGLKKVTAAKNSLKSGKSKKNVKNGTEDGKADKKMRKKMEDLEQTCVDQETDIRRLETKVKKLKNYCNELESEKMKAKMTNLTQREKIKELKARLYELE